MIQQLIHSFHVPTLSPSRREVQIQIQQAARRRRWRGRHGRGHGGHGGHGGHRGPCGSDGTGMKKWRKIGVLQLNIVNHRKTIGKP